MLLEEAAPAPPTPAEDAMAASGAEQAGGSVVAASEGCRGVRL